MHSYFFGQLSQLLFAWQPLAYLSVFLGMIIEGDVVLFTAAFLTQEGFFNPVFMFASLFAGILIGDTLWYKLGAYVVNSDRRAVKAVWRLTKPFDTHMKERPLRTIFVSKFAYGIHHVLLMRAGAIGIPFRKFIEDDAISSLCWIFVVGGLGYFSSYSFGLTKEYLRFAEIALLIGIIVFVLLENIIRQLLKNRL